MTERVEDPYEQLNPSDRKGYVSERGPFEIWENPDVRPSYRAEAVDVEKAADGFEYGALAEKYGEQPVRQKIGEMLQSYAQGSSVTPLFAQRVPGGMSLVHAWFGPNLPLFRHSHPRYGDCLYYVVAGELRLGNRRLGPGSGFFVPNGHPYKYTAGPAGVEVLEFRAGGGDPDAPGMKLEEHSLDSIQKVIDGANANRDSWHAPAKLGDTRLRQAGPESDG